MAKAVNFPTPLLRVSRPVSACQRCRAAKVKCDGKLPACTACEKAGRSEECSSASDHFAKGKERSYVTSLETQIEKLERRLAQVKDQDASIDMLEMASAVGILPKNSPPSSRNRKSENQETSNVDDLVSDFGFLSVNATARDFHGFTGEISFAKLVFSMSSSEPIPTNSNFSLPPRYEVAPLIQHYVDNINVLYPFIPETSLFRSIDKVYGQGGLYANPIDHWITLMTIAVSRASQVHVHGDSHYKEALKYTAAALEHAEHVIRPGSSSGIQAILLMVLLAMWIPRHYSSWYLIGVASRAAVDLGLHQDPPFEFQAKSSGYIQRGRIFDCVYSLDRYISMVHQRPFSFTDASINFSDLNERSKADRTFPLFSVSLKPAEDLLNLRRIQSTPYQKLFQSRPLSFHAAWPTVHAAIHDMAQWYSLLSSQVDRALLKYYRCEILYASVLMMTSSFVDNLLPHGKFLLLQYAMEYAESINSAISDISKRAGLYTFHDLQRVSFVSRHFLAMLKLDHEAFLSTSAPSPPATTSGSSDSTGRFTSWPLLSIPPLSMDNVTARLDKICQSLEHFEIAIEYFCSTYGYTDPLQEYQVNARSLKRTLEASKELQLL